MRVIVVIMGCGISQFLLRGVSVKYIFLAITYFCSFYITVEELKKLLYLCCLVVLLREVTIHISNQLWNLVFPRIRKESSLCEFNRICYSYKYGKNILSSIVDRWYMKLKVKEFCLWLYRATIFNVCFKTIIKKHIS